MTDHIIAGEHVVFHHEGEWYKIPHWYLLDLAKVWYRQNALDKMNRPWRQMETVTNKTLHRWNEIDLKELKELITPFIAEFISFKLYAVIETETINQ